MHSEPLSDTAAVDVSATIRDLQAFGYAVVDRAVDQPTVERLRRELDVAMRQLPPYTYPFGEQRRLPALDDAAQALAPVSRDLMFAGAVDSICDALGAHPHADLIVWSHEHRPDKRAIYGRPHFDRRHQLKVFVYLTDVGPGDGPTHVAAEHRGDFTARWIAAWRRALEIPRASDEEVYQRARATDEHSAMYRGVACDLEVSRAAFTPLTGSAGTLIFFDTSLAHFGGLVSGGGTRQTLRRHCILG